MGLLYGCLPGLSQDVHKALDILKTLCSKHRYPLALVMLGDVYRGCGEVGHLITNYTPKTSEDVYSFKLSFSHSSALAGINQSNPLCGLGLKRDTCLASRMLSTAAKVLLGEVSTLKTSVEHGKRKLLNYTENVDAIKSDAILGVKLHSKRA